MQCNRFVLERTDGHKALTPVKTGVQLFWQILRPHDEATVRWVSLSIGFSFLTTITGYRLPPVWRGFRPVIFPCRPPPGPALYSPFRL